MKKVEDKLVAELRKHLPVADPKLTPLFLEEIKAHLEKYDEPEMLQEKLYMLATSAMPSKMMIKWLQRWNSSAAIRDAHRFPKVGFGDSKFLDWLNRATWWAQVSFVMLFHHVHYVQEANALYNCFLFIRNNANLQTKYWAINHNMGFKYPFIPHDNSARWLCISSAY